jgi:hypothetical protein
MKASGAMTAISVMGFDDSMSLSQVLDTRFDLRMDLRGRLMMMFSSSLYPRRRLVMLFM